VNRNRFLLDPTYVVSCERLVIQDAGRGTERASSQNWSAGHDITYSDKGKQTSYQI